MVSASSLEKSIRTEKKTKKELAETIGKEIAKRSIENGIKDVIEAYNRGKVKDEDRCYNMKTMKKIFGKYE